MIGLIRHIRHIRYIGLIQLKKEKTTAIVKITIVFLCIGVCYFRCRYTRPRFHATSKPSDHLALRGQGA